MITNMKATKSVYDDNHSNWATTINFSSSLRSYANEKSSYVPSNRLFDYRKKFKCSNSNTVKRIQIHSDPLHNRTIQLTSHLKMTPKNQRQFTCTYCPFSCTWFYDLKIHLRQKHKINNATRIIHDKH